MKGAVTAVTQSYIFVPRTVNIHEDTYIYIYVLSFTQMYRDVRGIKQELQQRKDSASLSLYILMFRVIERRLYTKREVSSYCPVSLQ